MNAKPKAESFLSFPAPPGKERANLLMGSALLFQS